MICSIQCGLCQEVQDLKLRIIIDWVDEDDRYGDVAAGRVLMRCKNCGREIINHRFEE